MHGNLWQYIVVFIILLGLVIWILINLFSKKKRNSTGKCCGCSLSEVCESKKLQEQECDGVDNRKCHKR